MNLDFGRCQVYKLNISACLTERELDYYNLFCDGITRKELKKRLGVDYPTSEMLSEEFHISLEDAADLLKAQMNKKCFRKFLTDEIEKFSPNEVREIRKSAIYVADEEGNLTDRIKDNKKIVWFGNECVRRCNVDLKDIPLLDQFLDEKFAYELNEFSKNMYDLIENNENKIIAGVVKRYNHLPDRCIAMLRISRNFHDNNPEKAYEFYKERMPNVCVEIMSEKISEEEFQKQYEFSESSKKIAYSGRAKSLNCNFYCDSGHHKIVYTADDNKEIKCPLIMHYDGNISISAYCSRCHWNENVVGNVFDGKSLREMITEWNYRTPLTCDEACELEEFRMLNDLKEKSERRDFYSKIGGTELSEEKIEKATFGKEFEIFYLENYRLKLHERVPALTTDEIENISIYALDLVRSKKEMSEEEYKNAEREMDIEISRMAFEHLYDDIKEVHERLPYLTPEECQEWFDCWKRWSAFQDNKLWNILTFDYVMRGWKLEELNDQREKNMSSLFDYIVLGNQEGKIKDGSE